MSDAVNRTRDPNERAIASYLTEVLRDLSVVDASASALDDPAEVARLVFDILTERDFCYLSKSRVARYRRDALGHISAAVSRSEPIPFFYDLGAGYHAAVTPGSLGLRFDVGLAELLVLRQIARFQDRVRSVYPPGVRFSLVIDNIAGYLINDVPLDRTNGYCRDFRELIRHVGLKDTVDLLVESEHYTVEDFEKLGVSARPNGESRTAELTRADHANVERFLGRPCDEAEARMRLARHDSVIAVSDQLLEQLIDGVHMTQRATDSTICFRPFPGGDSRVQVGDVALTCNAKGVLRPVLLTSRSLDRFSAHRLEFPGVLPHMISHITYAERKQDGDAKPSTRGNEHYIRREVQGEAEMARCAQAR